MKVILKDNMWVDGMEYMAGKVYDLPDWLAKSYTSQGIAMIPPIPKSDLKSVKPVDRKITKIYKTSG